MQGEFIVILFYTKLSLCLQIISDADAHSLNFKLGTVKLAKWRHSMEGWLTWITGKWAKPAAKTTFDASLISDVSLSISLSQAVSSVCPCCSVGEYDSFDYATVLAYSKLAFWRTQNLGASLRCSECQTTLLSYAFLSNSASTYFQNLFFFSKRSTFSLKLRLACRF